MLERIWSSPEAAERIRAFGEKKIWQFLDEVTLGSVRNLADFLPVIHGFRQQSEAGIKQQKLTLAKRIANKSSGTEHDFIALYMMWRAWAWEQLGDPDAVDRLLDDLENVLTRQKSHGGQSGDDLRQGALSFLSELKLLSLENKCSREKIARLIEFSPLALDDAGQQIVDSCKSELEIERDRTITELPKRLREEEKEIESIKDQLGEFSADVKAAVAKATLVEQASDAHRHTLRLLSETGERLVKALAAVEGTTKQNTGALRKLENRTDELSGKIRSSDSRQENLDAQLKSTAQSISEAIAQLKSIVEPLQQKFSALSPVSAEAMDSVVNEVLALGAKLSALSEKPTSEDFEALEKRIDAVESAKARDPPKVGDIELTGVSVTLLSAESNVAIHPLADAGEIIDALAASLQSVGLKKSAAVLLAGEVGAAILTGQAATFRGAMAHLVARKCADTLSSGYAWNISIPIGLADGQYLRSALHALSSKSISTVHSVVLEGLNRSALDCTKEALLAYAADFDVNHKSSVFCFTSLVSGVASLPLEPEHIELGPVFDLDYLDWRLSPETGAAGARGSVTPDIRSSLRTTLTRGTAEDIDEALRVLRKFMPKRNPRIERAVAAGYAALKNTRQGRSDSSPMQSLAYGWFVPLCVALGLSKEDVDSELDGGKCDASNADPRVAAMLNLEPFGAGETEGGE